MLKLDCSGPILSSQQELSLEGQMARGQRPPAQCCWPDSVDSCSCDWDNRAPIPNRHACEVALKRRRLLNARRNPFGKPTVRPGNLGLHCCNRAEAELCGGLQRSWLCLLPERRLCASYLGLHSSD